MLYNLLKITDSRYDDLILYAIQWSFVESACIILKKRREEWKGLGGIRIAEDTTAEEVEIDRLVYELYGLTGEDILIVKG